METNDIHSNYATSGTAAAQPAYSGTGARSNSSVDPNQFMQLIMAQLTHQNPMEPMKDAEMMSQMAQLNSLQELQKISQAMSEMAMANHASYAASLIGKTVRADDGSSTTEGKVTGVTIVSGKMYVQVGDLSFPLDLVTEITGEAANE